MSGPTTAEDGGQANVTLGTLQRLYETAFDNYEKFRKEGPPTATCFWDGYCRGIEEVINAHHHE
jgi:hypothetical protein